MPIPIENNSWDYVQRLIEREINSAFKSIQTKWNNMKNKTRHREGDESTVAFWLYMKALYKNE